MGYGDSLMAAGHAERIFNQDPSRGPIAIYGADGQLRWHPLWLNNPAIYCGSNPPESLRRITFGGRNGLPYYPAVETPTGRVWPSAWRVRDHRPSFYPTDQEKAFGDACQARLGPYVVLEPTGKDRKSLNRVWKVEHWQAVADALTAMGVTVVQLDRPEARMLDRVHAVPHRSFREACAVLRASRLFVGTEGGLSIAAGALRMPAVILVSPCGPPPEVIGFPEHTHLMDDGPGTPCGYMTPCGHCRTAWDRLQPDTVVSAILEALG